MQVILLETIGKMGGLGDVANVKAGYARNFLIPQGKAKPATKANLAEFESIRAELEAKEQAAIKIAQNKANAMAGAVCVIKANASEKGKLFGSVTTADIVASLATTGHKVKKREINLSEVIHHVGEYDVNVVLHADISADIKVVVEATEKIK